MTEAGLELLRVSRETLLSNSKLWEMIKDRVYDVPLFNSKHPYVSIDELASRDISGTGVRLEEHRLRLKAYSRGSSKEGALLVLNTACQVLRVHLKLPNYRVILFVIESLKVNLMQDRRTTEATGHLKILTEPEPRSLDVAS